jgi:DNA-binding NarL/FixJ family response regulator
VVLVVDDNEELLKLLGDLLTDAGHEVLPATTIAGANRWLAERRIDVALVDLYLGTEAGMDLVTAIGSRIGGEDEIAVIVVSAEREPSAVVQTLALGAVDFVRKPFDNDELVARVGSALRSKRALDAVRRERREDAEAAARTTTAGDERARARAVLTDAEDAVAIRVAQGLTNRNIASDLFVSVKAVEFHLGNIFRKLEVRNRTELALRLRDSRAEPPV